MAEWPHGRWVSDTLPSQKYRIWTRANAGEVMPDPVSPLSSTLSMGAAGEMGWRDAYVRSGVARRDEFDPDRMNPMGVHGGYLFLNMSMSRLFGVRFPDMTPEQVDLQYFGDMPGIPTYASEARPSDVDEAQTMKLALWAQASLSRADLQDLADDRAELDRLIARRPDLSACTDQELIDHARSFAPLYRRLFCKHILVSTLMGFGVSMVSGVCAAVGKPELAMVLISGLGEVDSAEPSWHMWDLSRIAAASPAIAAAFERDLAGVPAAVSELAAGGDEAAAMFLSRWTAFLAKFASRGPNEWELRAHVWGTHPEIALTAIDRMRFAPDGESPQDRTDRRVAEREGATAALREALAGNAEAGGAFEAGLHASHLYAPGRERSKTNNILVVHEMRLPMREWGRRLVEQGVFDHIEQVFMLTDDELDDAVVDPGAFTEIVREREAFYLSLFDLIPPFVMVGEPAPHDQWDRHSVASAEQAVVGTTLTGIAGCSGVAVGRARVVLDPADPRGLEPGEVLVAPYTDPSWTPLFVTASAVVVDVGAQITHAVIVSRELGLPCVVSAIGATRTIPDGALVEVDGNAGTVKVLELPA